MIHLLFHRISGATVLLAVALLGVSYVSGQMLATQQERTRTINVEGFGEVSSRPDTAKVTLGVATGTQPTSNDATQLLAATFDSVQQELAALGINTDDIQTTNISVSPVYAFVEGERREEGFEASQQVTVTVRDTKIVGDVISQTAREGVNQVGGVSFETDDDATLKDKARTAAIEDAKQRAAMLADQLGLRIVGVRSFQETGTNVPQPYAALRADGIGGSEEVQPVPISPGMQDTTAHVTVTFEVR